MGKPLHFFQWTPFMCLKKKRFVFSRLGSGLAQCLVLASRHGGEIRPPDVLETPSVLDPCRLDRHTPRQPAGGWDTRSPVIPTALVNQRPSPGSRDLLTCSQPQIHEGVQPEPPPAERQLHKQFPLKATTLGWIATEQQLVKLSLTHDGLREGRKTFTFTKMSKAALPTPAGKLEIIYIFTNQTTAQYHHNTDTLFSSD